MSRPRHKGLVALALSLAAVGSTLAQERHRTVGDFEVVIDKDPLTLDENLSASVVSGADMFGLRCLEGKVSLGVRAHDAPALRAGESVDVKIRFGDALLTLAGTALNATDIEIAGAETQLERLAGAPAVDIALANVRGAARFTLRTHGIDKAVAMVRLACGL